MKVLVISVLLVHILGSYSFIIPDELPSILSVIYSNIPTIKKGTDSRIGWGFRLGDRADFQVLVELGPQTNTQPLANQGGSGNSKRNSVDSLANTLWAQRQKEKIIKEEEEKRIRNKENESAPEKKAKKKPTNQDGDQWLKTWSKSVNDNSGEEIVIRDEPLPLKPKPGLGIGEIDAKSVIPEDSVLLIEELKKRLEKIRMNMSTVAPSTTTTEETLKKDSLDKVDDVE